MGPQSGKSDLGMSAITSGIDFKWNTSLAEAKLLSSDGAIGTFCGGSSDAFSVIIGFWAGMSVAMDEVVVSKST